MKVLITGGSGFIGTNLVSHYLMNGAEVINVDTCPPRNKLHLSQWRDLDINSKNSLADLVLKFDPDYCFHLAARTDLQGSSISDYLTNTLGVENIVFALNQCSNLKLAVFASSMLVCKIGYHPKNWEDYCPTTPYGESKVIGEKIVKETDYIKFPWLILRPTSIWGPWFGEPYRNFFTLISKNGYFHPGNLIIRRSYGFVLNTIYQLSKVQQFNGGGLLYKTSYLADYSPIDLLSWATSIQQSMKTRSIKSVPIQVFQAAAKFGDFLKIIGYKEFPMTSFRLNNMLTESVFEMDALQSLTGRLPYSYQDGVRITCDWLLEK